MQHSVISGRPSSAKQLQPRTQRKPSRKSIDHTLFMRARVDGKIFLSPTVDLTYVIWSLIKRAISPHSHASQI
jgi:hypothetical protein